MDSRKKANLSKLSNAKQNLVQTKGIKTENIKTENIKAVKNDERIIRIEVT